MVRGKARFIVAAIIGLVAAFWAFRDAGGNAYRDTDPSVAIGFDPGNELIHQEIANIATAPGADQVDLMTARGHTLLALRKAPGLGSMLRSYAILAEDGLVDGDPNAIMSLAARFSKRDLTIQLWLIERMARSGDTDATIRKYDDALRANRSIGNLLYPLLARAIADDDLRPSIVEMLRRQPDWGDTFYLHMARSPKLAVYMPELLSALGESAKAVPLGTRELAAGTLLRAGRVAAAQSMAVPPSLRGNLGEFTNADGAILPPFAWHLTPQGTISVSPRPDGSLLLLIGTGSGGIVADRVVPTAGGRIAIEGIMTAQTDDEDRLPRLKLECRLGSGMEDMIKAEPVGRGLFAFSGSSELGGCVYADLALLVPSNLGKEMRVEIRSLRLSESRAPREDEEDPMADEDSASAGEAP